MRLHQELVLGVGGVRALRELDLAPAVWHLNEGHSAFLLAERTRELVATGQPLDDALDTVRRNSVFTIHTPGRRRQRALRRRPRAPGRRSPARRRRPPEHRRRPRRAAAEPRPRRRERRLPVRHDGPVPAHDPRRERGLAAARPHRERDLARHQPARDPRPHQRRPHADLGGPAHARHPRALHERRPRDDGRPAGRPPVLGSHRQGPGGRAVGGPPAPEARARDLRPRPAAQPVRAPRRGAVHARGARGASSTRRS